MKKIQFILMASFVLGTCQLVVLSGAADELDVKESTIELSLRLRHACFRLLLRL